VKPKGKETAGEKKKKATFVDKNFCPQKKYEEQSVGKSGARFADKKG